MLLHETMTDLGGLEFATFKLKPGVSEDKLIELSKCVEERFLSQQDELILHCLVRGKDGVYADIAMATSQQKAEEYCQQWLQDATALEYLELIDHETVDMTFWSRIN
ncbi:hypothetical protein ACFOEK_19880 [Litoribrevibacter euphylliae]|uniref:DUF4242 domain-containing protein n=1 Tax=Litoribrevibacter euphylliae TaxID=1834034 RepID=A0ABV7HLI1_9GAMM